MTEQATTGGTYFLPLSGRDAVNYIVIASQVKIAAHEDVSVEHLHFVSELRSIIHLHKQHYRTEITEDGSVRKSTSPKVIAQMDDLLARLRHVGLRLCFSMWSVSTAQELVRSALAEAEAVDSDYFAKGAKSESIDESYGAVVAFLLVPQSLPVLIPNTSVGHPEVCVSQVFDWQLLPDQLAEV